MRRWNVDDAAWLGVAPVMVIGVLRLSDEYVHVREINSPLNATHWVHSAALRWRGPSPLHEAVAEALDTSLETG